MRKEIEERERGEQPGTFMTASRNGEHNTRYVRSSSHKRFVVQLCQLNLSGYRLVSEPRNVKRIDVNIY